MIRRLSHSEISTALTCEARHAFGYTGRLTNGEVLKRRELAPVLSNGRAWGAAVAAWHSYPEPTGLTLTNVYQPMLAKLAAHAALRASYAADVSEQRDMSVWVPTAEQVLRENWLASILDDYMNTAARMVGLHRLEEEFDLPIPSRTGKQASSRYHFEGFIDGWLADPPWVVEYKLRDTLTDPRIVQNDRQIRRYAWAHQQLTDMAVIGAIVDERLAAVPKPPKLVLATKKAERHYQGLDERWYTVSHDKRQLCRPAEYLAACEAIGAKYHPETLEVLARRLWQFRHQVVFRRGELKEAGEELVSVAKTIRDLDSGERYPVRNTQPQICRGCRYFEACPNPHDTAYLDTLFVRRAPKRDRTGNGGEPDSQPEMASLESFADPSGPFDFAAATYDDVPEAELWRH